MEIPANKKPLTDEEKRERGIEEHERANYSAYPPDEEKETARRNPSDIRETDDAPKTDTGASDLAGTASGNLEEDDLPDDEK